MAAMTISEFAKKINLTKDQYMILLQMLSYYDTERCVTLHDKLVNHWPEDHKWPKVVTDDLPF